MKLLLLLGAGLLPLAGAAQGLPADQVPVTYHAGPRGAPLYSRLRDPLHLADTLRTPNQRVPPYAEAIVVGRVEPHWVVVRRSGFLYATPISRLSDYSAADVAALPVDAQTGRITYQGVVAVPGVSQAELYARLKAWVPRAYTQQNAAVERDDPATGQLRLRGNLPVTLSITYDGAQRPTYAGIVRHTLTVYVKDGRYKYVLTDLAHDALRNANLKSGGPLEQESASLFGYAGLGSHKPWNDLKTQATRDARQLLASLQEALTQQKPQPVSQPAPAAPAKDPSDF